MKIAMVMAAGLALGAWQAARTPVRPVISEARGLQDWENAGNGAWAVHGDVLALEKAGVPGGPVRRPAGILVLRDHAVRDFTLDLEVKSTAPVDLAVRDVVLVFGYQSPTRFYYTHMAAKTDAVHNGIFLVDDADRKRLDAPDSTAHLKNQEWHRVRLVRDTASGRIEVSFDGTPMLSATDRTLLEGRIGVGSFDETGEFRNITLTGVPAENAR